MPRLGAQDLDDLEVTQATAKGVWVPNRNGIFIHVAAALAERSDAVQVVVGFNREEAATFPDNSAEYMHRVSRALELSTANHVRVASYTVDWDKFRIVAEMRKIVEKPFPFELLWSCYEGKERPCGGCESCRRLARALGA